MLIRESASVTRLGGVWKLGRHRLVCGDATDPASVAKALRGKTPRLMVTDPPYGVRYEPSWRNASRLKPDGKKSAGLAVGKIVNDDRFDWTAAWALFPGDVAYVWHSALHSSDVERGLQRAGFLVRSQIIWDKGRLVISRGHYHWRHEGCWYAVRKGATAGWTGDRRQTTVWQVPHRRNETGHAAQKPVLCMQRPIENHSQRGELVYDPFVGSGTTIIAAEASGRIACAIEINPSYCDMAIERWQKLTGLAAVKI